MIFINLLKITTDIDLFDIIIDNFPNFKDRREYQGKNLYFYKLAQLLVLYILHIREIKENSRYEIEIRASMIVVIDRIKKLDNYILSIDIYDIIWSLGQDKQKNLKPYHLTRTMSY